MAATKGSLVLKKKGNLCIKISVTINNAHVLVVIGSTVPSYHVASSLIKFSLLSVVATSEGKGYSCSRPGRLIPFHSNFGTKIHIQSVFRSFHK